jgi:RNA polymerase sigma factor (sigma-70 family)
VLSGFRIPKHIKRSLAIKGGAESPHPDSEPSQLKNVIPFENNEFQQEMQEGGIGSESSGEDDSAKLGLDMVDSAPSEDASQVSTSGSRKLLTFEEESALTLLAHRESELDIVRLELFRKLKRSPKPKEWAKEALGASATPEDLAAVRLKARAARRALVSYNMGLVVSIAKGYYSSHRNEGQDVIVFDDLVQEGVLGLMRAIDRYEPKRGYRLSTFATYWIRWFISSWLSNDSNLIRVPQYIRNVARKANRASDELSWAMDRDPTFREVVESMDGDPAKNAKALDRLSRSRVLSYDKEFSGKKSTPHQAKPTFVECISDEECVTEGLDLQDSLALVLSSVLTDQELDVICLRYGLDGGIPRMQQECADLLGTSKYSVRKICKKTFTKIKGSPEGVAFGEYYENT